MKYLVMMTVLFGLTACGSMSATNKEQASNYDKCGVVYKDKDGVNFTKTECKGDWPANFPG